MADQQDEAKQVASGSTITVESQKDNKASSSGTNIFANDGNFLERMKAMKAEKLRMEQEEEPRQLPIVPAGSHGVNSAIPIPPSSASIAGSASPASASLPNLSLQAPARKPNGLRKEPNEKETAEAALRRRKAMEDRIRNRGKRKSLNQDDEAAEEDESSSRKAIGDSRDETNAPSAKAAARKRQKEQKQDDVDIYLKEVRKLERSTLKDKGSGVHALVK